MADEALVLAAQVVDQFSNRIKDMQRQLRLLVENNAKAHTQGTGLAKVHTKAYSELLVSVRQTARIMQADFAPIVEKIGFAATSTGLAFGGLTAGIAAVVGAGAGLGMMFQGTAQNLDLSAHGDGALESIRCERSRRSVQRSGHQPAKWTKGCAVSPPAWISGKDTPWLLLQKWGNWHSQISSMKWRRWAGKAQKNNLKAFWRLPRRFVKCTALAAGLGTKRNSWRTWACRKISLIIPAA